MSRRSCRHEPSGGLIFFTRFSLGWMVAFTRARNGDLYCKKFLILTFYIGDPKPSGHLVHEPRTSSPRHTWQTLAPSHGTSGDLGNWEPLALGGEASFPCCLAAWLGAPTQLQLPLPGPAGSRLRVAPTGLALEAQGSLPCPCLTLL